MTCHTHHQDFTLVSSQSDGTDEQDHADLYLTPDPGAERPAHQVRLGEGVLTDDARLTR